jgi:hypothetical protein
MEAGFFLRIVLRERRYANLGHLLPMFPIERAVKPGVSALPRGWPATNSLPRDPRSASVFPGIRDGWRGLQVGLKKSTLERHFS